MCLPESILHVEHAIVKFIDCSSILMPLNYLRPTAPLFDGRARSKTLRLRPYQPSAQSMHPTSCMACVFRDTFFTILRACRSDSRKILPFSWISARGRITLSTSMRRLVPLLTAAVVAITAVLLGLPSSRAQAAPTPAEEAHWQTEKSLGSPSAPIRLTVYDDYECPACGQFYEQTLRQLIDTYVADGKVYLVHRDFPLPMHEFSRQAARWVKDR